MRPLERDDRIDQELAKRVRNGDRAAYEELFRAYFDTLVRFVNRLVFAPDVAEDLVQDALHRFWLYRERPGFPPTNISRYLFGAVRKNVTTHLRHRQVEIRWEESLASDARGADTVIGPRPSQGADAQVRFNELAAALRVAVDELPPRCRQAFLLCRQHGMSYNEIAKVMGIAPKTVEIQIGTALRTLRLRLAAFL